MGFGAAARALLLAVALGGAAALRRAPLVDARAAHIKLPSIRCAPGNPTAQAPESQPPVTAKLGQRMEDASAVAAPLAAVALAVAAAPLPVEAADTISTAVVAYSHYLGLILLGIAVTAQRVLLREDMSEKDFDTLVQATFVYVVAVTIVFGSGAARVVEYGKGWNFYSHDAVFWLKVALSGVFVASGAFPTIIVAKCALTKGVGASEGEPPFSPALMKRMTSVLNAELLAIVSIPLTATLMARGVGYLDWLPWAAGAVPAAGATVALTAKYAKEALAWKVDSE